MRSPAIELARWAATGLLAFLLAAAAILWWRRLAGAFSVPLQPAALLAVATSLAAVVAVARIAWPYKAAGRRAGLRSRLAAGALSTATLAIAAALSYPGTPALGLVILWAILAAEECWAWGPTGGWRFSAATKGRSMAPKGRYLGVEDRAGSRGIGSAARFQRPPDAQVTRQMTRSHTAGGSELLSGWIRVPMAAGQRSANVHVAFCPPFARNPRVSIEQREGPHARIKTVQVLSHGARFDLKLAAPEETVQTVLLQFSAEAPPASEPTPPAPDAAAQT